MKFALIADFICVNYRNSRLIFRLRKDVKMPQAGLKFLAISIRAENRSKIMQLFLIFVILAFIVLGVTAVVALMLLKD